MYYISFVTEKKNHTTAAKKPKQKKTHLFVISGKYLRDYTLLLAGSMVRLPVLVEPTLNVFI